MFKLVPYLPPVLFFWISLILVWVSPAHAKPPFPVIFIHGINSSADTWEPFGNVLEQAGWEPGGCPRFDGTQVSDICPASDLLSGDPIPDLNRSGDFYRMEFSHNENLTLDQQGQELEAIIDRVLSLNPDVTQSPDGTLNFEETKVILVGHSMGGLAARNYLQFRNQTDDVSKLITIGTPHQGVDILAFCTVVNICGVGYGFFGIDPYGSGAVSLHADNLASTLNDLIRYPLPNQVFYTSIIVTGTRVILSGGQDGDGLVTVDSQNLRNIPNTNGLVHESKSIYIGEHWPCDQFIDDILVPNISHPCETEDRGVWAELLQQLRSQVTESPQITSVIPNTLLAVPLPQTQQITITGTGFLPTSTLTFNNSSGEEFTDRIPDFISSTQLEYDIAVGPDADEWTVKVLNGTVESNAFPFTVVADSTDTTPPPAPLNLAATPDSWTSNNLFSIDWTNPVDPSEIAKVWYKVGAAPAFSNDGAVLAVPRFQPFYATATIQGGQPVHVWLEDGAGNKDQNNRSSVTLYHEATPPTGSVVINGGDANTSSLLATLNLGASDTISGMGAGAQMRFSNDNNSWSPPEPYSTTRTNWHLSSYGGTPDPGAKRVYVQFQDVAGNWSASFDDEITYTQTTTLPPPGPFTLYVDPPFCENGEAYIRFFRENSTDAGTYSLYRDGQFYQNYPPDNALVITHSLDGQAHDFYVEATNTIGVNRSNTVTVTIPLDVCPPLPTVTTEAATGIDNNSMTLHGTVNGDGNPVEAWFEWGRDTSYGTSTTARTISNDTQTHPFSWSNAGLACGTEYHYRAVARNNSGLVYGEDRIAETDPCTIPPGPFAFSVEGPSCGEDGSLTARVIWTASEHAAFYTVFWTGRNQDIYDISTLSIDLTGFEPEVNTVIWMWANNTAGRFETDPVDVVVPPCAEVLPDENPPTPQSATDFIHFQPDLTDGTVVDDMYIREIEGDVFEANGTLTARTEALNRSGSFETYIFPYNPAKSFAYRKRIRIDTAGLRTVQMICKHDFYGPNGVYSNAGIGTVYAVFAGTNGGQLGVNFIREGSTGQNSCSPQSCTEIPIGAQVEEVFVRDVEDGYLKIFVDGVLIWRTPIPPDLPSDVETFGMFCSSGRFGPGPKFEVTEWLGWIIDGLSDQDDGSTEPSPPRPDDPDPPTDPGRDPGATPGPPTNDGSPSTPPTNPGRNPGDVPGPPVDGVGPGEPTDEQQGRGEL